MASWKKVLVSGSSIEVNQITASGVPTTDNESNLLVIDSNGSITQMDQSNVAGTNPTFNIEAVSGSTFTSGTFNTGDDHLIFSASDAHGFGFTHTVSGDTSSINLQTPQNLNTSANVHFQSLKVDQYIYHAGDAGGDDTFISFEDNKIHFNAGGVEFVEFDQNATQNAVNINDGGADVDFRVEGNTDTHLLFIDANKDRVAIGTPAVDTGSLLTVDGNINVGGITGSFPTVTDAKFMLVLDPVTNKLVRKQNIYSEIGAATASFSSSITGTANEVEVTGTPGNIVIGQPNDVIIGNDLTIVNDVSISSGSLNLVDGNITLSGSISASGNITASNLRVTNDIALGGNIFSFSGYSFIEGVAANFTGSNIFGSGSHPAANDTAGGGTAHQFTGSVGITGSKLELIQADITQLGGNISTNGSITATNGTGSFGYLTANVISSSGHLFASLPNDTTPIADGVVVYDTATGQLLYTASSAVGAVSYPQLTNIPDLIVSGAIALVESTQGEYDITVDGVTVSDGVSAGLLTSDSPTFTNLTLSGNGGVSGSLTVNSTISGSGHLFASLSFNAGNYNTVMYDTTTGQFFHTGSYGSGGVNSYTDLADIPDLIISGATFSSNGQGEFTSSINNISSSFDLGLTPSDDVTFTNLTATGFANITGNTTIGGNLTVNGSTTTISTSNLTIEDTFIQLASGSGLSGDTSAGIIVERSSNGDGTALFWDNQKKMWCIDFNGANGVSDTAVVDARIATIQQAASLPPTNPGYGATTSDYEQASGQLFIDTSDEHGIYIWT